MKKKMSKVDERIENSLLLFSNVNHLMPLGMSISDVFRRMQAILGAECDAVHTPDINFFTAIADSISPNSISLWRMPKSCIFTPAKICRTPVLSEGASLLRLHHRAFVGNEGGFHV
jgi:hypothetical protein